MINTSDALVYKVLEGHVHRGSLISLQPLRLSQIENLRVWRNSQMKVLRQSTILSTESQLAYFKELVMPELHSDYPSQILLAIYVSDQFVGYGGITNINWGLLKGEISFLLSPRYSEDTQEYKEIFEDYLKIISVIAFEVLGLNKIFTETFSFRESHLGVLSKTGFVIEGVFIMNCKKQGNYFDSVFHARFNSKILGDS